MSCQKIHTHLAIGLLASLGLLVTGCGQQAESSAVGETGQSTTEKIQTASTAQQAEAVMTEATADALLDQNDGAVALVPQIITVHGMPVIFPSAASAPPSLTFADSLTVLIDLDAVDDDGNDRYPNASGSFQIVADGSGSLVDDGSSGSIEYAVTYTVVDAITVTDPLTGNQAIWSADGGEGFWTSAIDWSYTDDNNWSCSAQVTKDVTGRQVTVIDADGPTYAASIDVDHVLTKREQVVAGDYSSTATWNGSRQVRWTNTETGTTHDVLWQVATPGGVTLTVDGRVFGPISIEEAVSRWNTRFGLH